MVVFYDFIQVSRLVKANLVYERIFAKIFTALSRSSVFDVWVGSENAWVLIIKRFPCCIGLVWILISSYITTISFFVLNKVINTDYNDDDDHHKNINNNGNNNNNINNNNNMNNNNNNNNNTNNNFSRDQEILGWCPAGDSLI